MQEYAEAAVWYRKGIYYTAFDESQFNFELQDIHREQVGEARSARGQGRAKKDNKQARSWEVMRLHVLRS